MTLPELVKKIGATELRKWNFSYHTINAWENWWNVPHAPTRTVLCELAGVRLEDVQWTKPESEVANDNAN